MPVRLVDNLCTTDIHTPRAGHVLNQEHRNTLEQPGTLEQLKNRGTPNLTVFFVFHYRLCEKYNVNAILFIHIHFKTSSKLFHYTSINK